MAFFETYLQTTLMVFLLVLARISGLMMTAPIFGTSEVPARVRAFLAIALAMLITPLQLSRGLEAPVILPQLAILAAAEMLVGISLGLGITLLLSGVQIAGQVISQLAGVQLADVINPTFDANVPVFSQLLFYVTLAVLVITGGHRALMDALLGTFAQMPPGAATISLTMVEALTAVLTQSFVLGIRAAAPTMIALLLATLVLGLLSRTLPQLNLMAVGFGFSSLMTLGTLSVTIGVAAWAFQEQLDGSLEVILTALETSPGG